MGAFAAEHGVRPHRTIGRANQAIVVQSRRSNGRVSSRQLEAGEERLQAFQNSGWQNASNALARYYHLIREGTHLGDTLRLHLPPCDFDKWYKEAEETQGGMAGTAHFNWPMETADAVSLQLELTKRLADERLRLIQIAHHFTHVDNHHDANIRQFFVTVFVPFHNGILQVLKPLLEAEEAATSQEEESNRATLPLQFISKRRIEELVNISAADFDLSKVISLAKELDFCYRNECVFAVAALTRSLIDHVPPIFGFRTFAEVTNNYPGTSSFKDSMKHLEGSARKIGDAHLHTPIRRRESLPTLTQVNFSNDIDVLLGEIVRLLTSN